MPERKIRLVVIRLPTSGLVSPAITERILLSEETVKNLHKMRYSTLKLTSVEYLIRFVSEQELQ